LLDRLPPAPAYWVAYSGGVDSHALLHLLWRNRTELPGPLGAVHVDHQLQGQSGDWAIHCRAVCEELGVAFHALKVQARPRPGESPEAAARAARYRGLADWLGEGHVLVSGQHLDDQAETLLLQLFRGAGPRGLAAMPERAPLGRGWLVRPMLPVRRDEILAYARQQHLRWVEDPSNTDLRYHRNLLRQRLMPELRLHWPGIARVLARAARHQADQLELADALARQDFNACAIGAGRWLSRSALAGLSPARQRNLLRYWVGLNALPLPAEAVVERVRREMLYSGDDARPRVHWPGAEVRRHRDRLYLMPPLSQVYADARHAWDGRETLTLERAGGRLSAQPANGCGLRMPPQGGLFEVCFRRGGEVLQPVGRDHHHALKKLFQAWGVPEWERGRVPLIYLDHRLVAVAGLCVAEGFQAPPGEPGIELHWSRISNWQ
jgi:tRNA(Ile)-lysidine synthase